MVNLTGQIPPSLTDENDDITVEEEQSPPDRMSVGFQDPAVVDPTTGKPYSPSGLMRQQQEQTRQAEALDSFNKLKLNKDLQQDIEAVLDEQIDNKPQDRSSSPRPMLRPKPKRKSPIDKVLELNYLLKEKSGLGKKVREKKSKIIPGLDVLNEDHQKTIKGFFDSAVGGDTGYDPVKTAWCAAFVSHILEELGADPLNPGAKPGSEGRYGRIRADKFKNYGSQVQPDDIREGDIVVFDFDKDGKADHVTFYAGNRITSQDDTGKFINVLGGNQSGQVSIRENHPLYLWNNVAAIRRITYDDIDFEFTKEMAEQDPVFNEFMPEYASSSEETTQTFDEGGLASKALDFLTSPLTGDYRKEKPTSVQMAEAGLDFTPVGTVDSIVEDPSWSNIALEVAPDLLGLGPAKKVGQSLIKGFKTGRGSTYKVEEGSRTTRERAPDEVGGEVVTQPTSGKTIYMSYDDMENFGLKFQKGEPGLYQFVPIEGKKGKAHLIFAKDSGSNKKGDPVPNTEVSFTTEPKVGDHPVEIYESTNNNKVSIHFGSEITEVMDDAPEMISVFPKPERMFPEDARPKGGDYLNPATGEVISGRNVSAATLKISPDGKPSFKVSNDDVESVGSTGKGKTQIKTNLFKKKAGWKWKDAPEGMEDIATLISVENKGKHYYTIETDFSKGVNLKKYPNSKTEPRLRPTVVGEIELGPQVGTISVRGKEHPVYSRVRTFNQGGPVMQEQMEMAFMQEGGIKDDGMKVDPVSGNEIPPGSMASEVRDDIPAMLSEGEYVVPADVLRFYGVNFFEDLRNKAKSGLQNMEANGRIGGEPLSPNQVQQNMSGKPQAGAPARMPVAANTGPYMAGQPQGLQQSQGMSQNFNPMNYGVVGGSTLGGGQQQESVTTFKTYVNAETNQSKVLEYINGQLKNKSDEQYTVPPYYEFGSAALKKAQQAALQPTPSSGDGGGDPPPTPEPKDPNEWAKDITNPEAWADENLQGKANSVIDTIQLGTSVARVNAMAIVAEAQGNTELANTLRGKARDFVAKNPVLNSLPNAWIDGDKIAEDLQKDKDRAKNLFGMKTEEQKKFAARAEQRKAEQRAKATEQAKADKAAAAAALKAAQSSQDDDDPFKVTDVDIDRDPMGQMTQTTTYEGIDPGLTTADEDGLYKGGLMARKKAKKK